MSFLPREWLWTVVPLVKFKDKYIDSFAAILEYNEKYGHPPKNDLIGTGTLVQHNSYFHLVTCEHVVKEGGRNLVAVYRNKTNPNGKFVSVLSEIHESRNSKWVFDESSDLAVTVFPMDAEKSDVKTVPESMFCSRANLTEGWNLYYFGYPVREITLDLFPAVRGGMIAMANHPQRHRILIDAMAAGGNSGGPVFLNPIPLATTTGKHVPANTPFIGIISKTLEKSIDLTPFDRLEYVAGISLVISSDAILELFDTESYAIHLAAFVEHTSA